MVNRSICEGNFRLNNEVAPKWPFSLQSAYGMSFSSDALQNGVLECRENESQQTMPYLLWVYEISFRGTFGEAGKIQYYSETEQLPTQHEIKYVFSVGEK